MANQNKDQSSNEYLHSFMNEVKAISGRMNVNISFLRENHDNLDNHAINNVVQNLDTFLSALQSTVSFIENDLRNEEYIMSPHDYLAWADEQDEKYEYRNGRVYAMSGASVRHNIISGNTLTSFNNQFKDRDCITTSADTRVHVAESKRVSYRYPDVVVICGEIDYHETRNDTITNPSILVEVLSPSTAIIDVNEKLSEYLSIQSLEAYITIAQDKPLSRCYTRNGDGWIFREFTTLNAAVCRIDSLNCALTLADVYAKVTFDDESAEGADN